ncbi:amino acid adenylation domain-containing protein [Nocardia yamanashiensis]|uniref:amino acid adenylation domain-containing protein n=1 Tax=Nocardia yamanashiensis TaxID=209247 RepID=UPI00082D1670|nr:non-ribosomal peptide synthetase [Nocardia yamanashiensis]
MTAVNREIRPLTGYQRDVVTVGALFPELPLAQIAGYVRISAPLDVDRVRECMFREGWRHEAMRMRIDAHAMTQWISDEAESIDLVDVSGAADPEAAAQEWVRRTTETVLPPDGQLIRAAIVVDGSGSFLLYVCAHHAVVDLWGLTILLRHWCEDYLGAESGAEIAAQSYTEFLKAEGEYRNSDRFQQDAAALTERVADLSPALFARGTTVREQARGRRTLRLTKADRDRLRTTGQSVFAVTATALAWYLRRIHRDGDIVLGVPLLNRRREDLYLVGHTANMLPLALDIDESLTLTQQAALTAEAVSELTLRQRFPLGDLQAALREQGRGGGSLFDVTYSYMSLPDRKLPDGIDEISVLSTGSSLDALNIAAREFRREGTIELDVFYAEDVFDADFPIDDLIQQVFALTRAALDAPDTPLAELDALLDADHARIAGFEGPEDGPLDRQATIDALVAAQIRRTPAAPALAALVDGTETTLSYAEFGDQVQALAGALRGAGLRAQEPVPLLLRRSPELVIAIHAVLAAGGAYVPIDPDYPPARIATVVDDCGARVLIAGPEFDSTALELGVSRIDPHTPRATPGVTPSSTRPDDLAYLIYTSGSTGKPKGVMIEHNSVVNRLTWMQNAYPLTADDVILQKTPATFDVSVWELMWWGLVGARVALLPHGGERDPRVIAAAITGHRVSVMHFVPSMLGPFLDHVTEQGVPAAELASLRLVFCSGEALTPALANRFRAVFAGLGLSHVRLINLYGPTEATVDVSYYEVGAQVSRVPIGRPIDNIALLVLDPAGRRCPVGVAGELNIAGVGVGRGYHGRDDLTAAAFVADERVPGRRRYRTGDLARWLADGNLEYLGRLDDQVKVRGNRITLGEIDNALAECPGVTAGVVVDARVHGEATTLVAYYAGPATDGEVAEHLAARLPGYMVPSYFVRMERIPLTGSGKADRKALPSPILHRAETRSAQTDSEHLIAEAWAEVLGVEARELSVDDDFFTVGGDSILALRLRTAAEQRGLRFDIDRFFARPTIADLAAAVDAGETIADIGVSQALELIPLIDRGALADAEDAFPATALQLGMLFHSLERRESTLYQDVFTYQLRMPWQEAPFRAAYARLVARQPALRSGFDLTGRSLPIQIVHHEVPGTLRIGASETAEPYVLDRAPLHRMRVLPDADGFELTFSFHHAILDGWSVANLVRELLQDYLHLLGFDIAPVDATPYPATLLAEYARAEQDARNDTGSRAYWSRLLADAPATALSSTRAYEPPAADGPVEVNALLPRWLRRAISTTATTERLPLKSILLTAHCLTLQAMTGADDIITGVVSHARPARIGGDSVAGLFLNTLPVRLGSTPIDRLDAVRQVAAQERESHPHRRYPLRAMIADHGGVPFDTAFNFVNYHVFTGVTAAADLALADFRIREETNFALLVTAAVDPRTDDITLRISAGRDSLSHPQCEEYGRLFIGVLAALVRDPHGRIDAAHARLEDAVHQIEAMAALRPNAPALVDDSSTWTYGHLDRAAETVALRLLADGLPANARIAVQLDRSPAQIAVVLGILRAGAAVVPLDPSYPEARRAAMIARAHPFRILTDVQDLLPQVGSAAAGPAHRPGASGSADGSSASMPARDAAGGVLPAIHPESIAYVLFTSGSTGEPKGVAMPHRGLANLVRWQRRAATAASGGVTVQFAPLSFDVSFQEIFATLAGGGTLRLITEEQRRDPAALARVVAESGAQRLYLPYVALQALAEAAKVTEAYPTTLSALVSSGEQLRITPEIRALAAANPGVVLENQYGPTESHVALAYSMSGSPERFPGLPPVGSIVGAAGVELLDERLRPVAPGVPGEIYLSGAGLARGYEGRPELTAQRFVAHAGGGIRYRTGDLGIELSGGDIVCLGRTDTQVKVRGFRVECAEVEFALAEIAGVEQAAVVARQLAGVDAALEAFLVAAPGTKPLAAEQVRGELRTRLPAHVVPARFHWIDALPLTPSGKRDDAALRRLAEKPATVAVGRAPADEWEREIAAILAEFSGTAEFAADTDFFAAGGTSIGAMRVAMTVAERWNVDLPLETFVATPTATGLAAVVRAGGAERGFDPLVPLMHSDSGATPLFLIHPIGGNIVCYVPLARHMGGDRPVYGLQAAGAVPGTTPLTTVQELAASYVAAIRRAHPHGPYHIAGWSFGGYVALEVARQLGDSAVEQLVLLDTMALRETPPEHVDEKDLIVWFFGELLWYAKGSEAAVLDLEQLFDTSASDRDELFDSILRQSVDHGILPPESSPQLVRRLYAVFHANFQAALAYRMSPVQRPFTLLRATDGLPASLETAHRLAGTMFGDADNGWERWANFGLDIREIPGDHLSMMTEPNIATVARLLADLLNRTPALESSSGND